jgi:hypothetical protein
MSNIHKVVRELRSDLRQVNAWIDTLEPLAKEMAERNLRQLHRRHCGSSIPRPESRRTGFRKVSATA